ncbi:hypothetical protein KP509_22G077700 [Ceratopteris richardii]|uniref:Pentatricopeptide repeat-containing protein n=1 Tax=Ceratopteris richardii TaxID=49495 RepID=A0A8T2S9U5_CERRI|nr:hypothetical protein KP509_22G077700 [Ceratopteris richardii]
MEGVAHATSSIPGQSKVQGSRPPKVQTHVYTEAMQAIGEQNLLSLNEEPKRVGLKHTACNNEVHPNAHIIDVIKSCAARKDLHKAYKIHSDLADRGLLQTDISFGNALISMYSKCGDLSAAEELFEKLPARNVITWNSLISGYVQSGLGYDALTPSVGCKMRASFQAQLLLFVH